jgi:hypothetical protein
MLLKPVALKRAATGNSANQLNEVTFKRSLDT